MGKYIKIAAVFLMLAAGCNTDDDNTPESGDRSEYRFYENSSIRVGDFDFAVIEDGTNLVFEYFFTADEEPNIADDEYSERIIFEISPELEAFSFSASELISANTYFDKYCFCLIEGSIPIAEGSISGMRIDSSTWDITIAITFEDFETRTRTIAEQFTLATR